MVSSRFMRLQILLIFLLLPILGCAAPVTSPVLSGGGQDISVVEPGPYVLGAGDQLRIQVFGTSDLSGPFTVGPQGDISYPLLGNIQVEGKTVEEFKMALVDGLQPDYVRNPRVTVEVLNYRPFYLLGEVQDPGTFEFVSGLEIVSAVALAGGFTYRADTKRVFIKHDGENDEKLYRLTSSTPVRPGDTIRIPERRF